MAARKKPTSDPEMVTFTVRISADSHRQLWQLYGSLKAQGKRTSLQALVGEAIEGYLKRKGA